MERFASKDAIEQRIYIYTCFFAVLNIFSVAGANIFLGLATAGLLHRLCRYHDDMGSVYLHYKKFFWIIGVLFAVSALSLINSLEPAEGLRCLLNYYIFRVMPLFAILFCVHEKRKLLIIAICGLGAVFINCIYALLQLYGSYPKVIRVSGAMDTMPFATVVSAAIAMVLVMLIGSQNKKVRWGSILFLCIAILANVFNGTRGAWLAVLAAVAIVPFLQMRNKKRYFAGMLVLLFIIDGAYVAVPSFHDRVHSIVVSKERSRDERFYLWKSSLNMLADHPLTGVGLGNFARNYQEHYILPDAHWRGLTHAHNNFLHCLAEGGVLGLGVFLALWGYLTAYAVKGWYRYRNYAYLIIFSLVLILLGHGLSEYTFGAAVTMKFFWLYLGLSFKWIELAEEAECENKA